MHPIPNYKLFPFILATILSTYFPTSFCDQTPNCSHDAFDCGSIVDLAYPFWGGSRPRMCGREGFEVICQGGVPTLNISSLSYRVQEIDFTTNTLKVAREDLIWNNRCPKVLLNTTMDFNLFKYSPESRDENVTLYYDCTDDHHPPSRLEALPNKFTCDVNGAETINLFTMGDTSSPNITCSSNIFVPINEKNARSLENPTELSINILQSALIAGFSVQWFIDWKQKSPPFCNANVYGSCIGSSNKIYTGRSCKLTMCRRVEGKGSIIAPAPAPAPAPDLERRQVAPAVQIQIESPNAQSRGYPPESGSYNRPMGNERPPVRSPGYHPEEDNFPTAKGLRAGKNHAKEIAIVLSLSITSAIIASIAICCFLKRQHSADGPNHECNQHVEKFLLQHGSLTPKRYRHSEIKKITKSFRDKLGQGGYGSVYKGVLPDSSLVAVKVLIETDSNGEEFINEVASISRTSHVNIVSLFGFCYEKKKRALVYEFMPNKSLDKFLNNDGSAMGTDCGLDLEKLYKIAVGIAKGLEYLHTGCSTRIVHFDIKPQNILLDEEFCPKISDFGLAKLCKKKQSVLSVLGTRGTIGYIAPEVFSRNFGGVSHKSDVYSYGMMVLEMAGSKKIVETEAFQSSENYFPDKIYEKVTIDVTQKLDNFIDEEEEDLRRKMFLVGFWCIQTTPSDRPSMSKVVEMLEGSLQSIGIPPKPFLFTPTQPGQEISSSFSAHVETENSAQD